MSKIDTKGLLLKIFIPAILLSFSYFILGHFSNIPHILLFCILGTFILVPIELAVILKASKREYGKYSIQSAFIGQEKRSIWEVLIIAFVFFGIAGLLSVFIAPLENQVFAESRNHILNSLPRGFDWTNYEYLRTFSNPMLMITCAYYGIFNVLIAPITEELFFRGYLTSHYIRQTSFTPIMISICFHYITFGCLLIIYFVYWHLHQLRMQLIRKRIYISVYVFIVYVISFQHQALYWRYFG